MDESLQELENELKCLRPRIPSAELLSRIEAGLAAPEQSLARERSRPAIAAQLLEWLGLNWRMSAMATAAVVAIAAVVSSTSRHPVNVDAGAAPIPSVAVADVPAAVKDISTPEPLPVTAAANKDRYHPVGAASVLYDMREDGTFYQTNNLPARRLRYRYVDTYTWKNPATNSSLKWSLPRDEVRVLPASLH